MLVLEEKKAALPPPEAEAAGVPLSRAEKIDQIAKPHGHTVLENGALRFLNVDACSRRG